MSHQFPVKTAHPRVIKRLQPGDPWYKRPLDWILPLPGPRELGKSEHDALPSRRLLSEEQESDPHLYTWEDWREEMKRDHKIAYFLREVFPSYFWVPERWVKDAWYWLKCKTLPSYKYHLLDLRNPGGGFEWNHGWRDRDNVLLIANFKILCDFVEREHPVDPSEGLSEEQRAEYSDDPHIKAHNEMMSLYHWWKSERAEAYKEYDRLLMDWCDIPNRQLKEERHYALKACEDKLEKTDQDNLHRLIEIRGYLWT